MTFVIFVPHMLAGYSGGSLISHPNDGFAHVVFRGWPYTGEVAQWSLVSSELQLRADGIWKLMRFEISVHSEEIRRNSGHSPTRFQPTDAMSIGGTRPGM